MKASTLSVLVLAFITAACGNDTPTAPSNTLTPASRFTEVFSGTLTVKGSISYTYTVTNAGPANITLSSLMTGTLGPASTAAVGIGTGVSSGTDCTMTGSMMLTASLVVQIVNTASPGSYCVSISDPGTLTAPLNFSILINHS